MHVYGTALQSGKVCTVAGGEEVRREKVSQSLGRWISAAAVSVMATAMVYLRMTRR
jgi:hypothetical protein